MKAQRYEVEAWVNPSAWEDQEEAQRVIEEIIAFDSDAEADWVRIAGGTDKDVEAVAWHDVEGEQEPQMWGVAEVAAHAGVSHGTIRAYLHRGQMPAPDGRVGRTPWWYPSTVRAWR